MSALFNPLAIRSTIFPNRVFVSPMCQYSSEDGLPNDWHLVHLGSRAIGGAGFVCIEASGVTAVGRITPWDAGIWSPAHAEAWKPIASFIRAHGSVPGIQIAHAGRKASTDKPWLGGKPLSAERGAWQAIGPSAIAFGHYPVPRAMTVEEIRKTVEDFRNAALYSLTAGFEVVEIHGAHGYLLHSFCSPLSNLRTDEYGGSLENRIRFPLEVARAVREVWPADKPLFYRISATDWYEGGWDVDQSVVLCKRLKELGVDMIDCSSGGNIHDQKIQLGPGYQVPFAERVRRDAGVPTIAVGLITEAKQAEEIVSSGKADAVCLARAMLRDPYWPLHAARELGATVEWPDQYKRAEVASLRR
jgi:2,4-dienoyl-CoA reductase-like NADH-dependent reductase (Old Yellow Enzyme family)